MNCQRTFSLLSSLTLLSAACIAQTSGPEGDDKAVEQSPFESFGELYWTGNLWQGSMHDPSELVCLATLISPSEIVTTSGCLPAEGDASGELVFRLGDEEAEVVQVDPQNVLMKARLGAELSAPTMAVATFGEWPFGSNDMLTVESSNGHKECSFNPQLNSDPSFVGDDRTELEWLFMGSTLHGYGWLRCGGGTLVPGGAVFLTPRRSPPQLLALIPSQAAFELSGAVFLNTLDNLNDLGGDGYRDL